MYQVKFTSTVEVEGAWNDDKEYDFSQASILVFLDRSEEEWRTLRTKQNSILCLSKKVQNEEKSAYRSALTEDRYQNLSPPYFVGSKAGWVSGIQSKEREEIATFVDFRNDWFDNLLPSIISLEMDLDKGKVSNRMFQLGWVFTCFVPICKTSVDMKNIETLTSFFKRMKVGQKDLLLGWKSGTVPWKDHYRDISVQ